MQGAGWNSQWNLEAQTTSVSMHPNALLKNQHTLLKVQLQNYEPLSCLSAHISWYSLEVDSSVNSLWWLLQRTALKFLGLLWSDQFHSDCFTMFCTAVLCSVDLTGTTQQTLSFSSGPPLVPCTIHICTTASTILTLRQLDEIGWNNTMTLTIHNTRGSMRCQNYHTQCIVWR